MKHCLDCGIRFLASPQNAGREDLRCPFGCAKRHRAQQSNERVKAYRHTEVGKAKKDALNAQRYRRVAASDCEPSRESPAVVDPQSCAARAPAGSPVAENATPSAASELPVALELGLDGVILDKASIVNSPMLPYIRTLVGVLDGVWFNQVEVVAWLLEVQRQRSMAYRSRRDYVLRFLHQHPP
jgi:hypothetical protein